jgi:hypothetical protein
VFPSPKRGSYGAGGALACLILIHTVYKRTYKFNFFIYKNFRGKTTVLYQKSEAYHLLQAWSNALFYIFLLVLKQYSNVICIVCFN